VRRTQGAGWADRQPARYATIDVTPDGRNDVLGLGDGQQGECAKFWMSVLTDLRNPMDNALEAGDRRLRHHV
jgi:hypothetical protein